MLRVWMAVRRTVDQEILGFLRVPAEREEYSVTLKPAPNASDRIRSRDGIQCTVMALDRVTLRILYYTSEVERRHADDKERAIYCDDKIEFWRRVPGFIEAKGADRYSKERT